MLNLIFLPFMLLVALVYKHIFITSIVLVCLVTGFLLANQSGKLALFISFVIGILGGTIGFLFIAIGNMGCMIGVKENLAYKPGDESKCNIPIWQYLLGVLIGFFVFYGISFFIASLLKVRKLR